MPTRAPRSRSHNVAFARMEKAAVAAFLFVTGAATLLESRTEV